MFVISILAIALAFTFCSIGALFCLEQLLQWQQDAKEQKEMDELLAWVRKIRAAKTIEPLRLDELTFHDRRPRPISGQGQILWFRQRTPVPLPRVMED